MQKWLVAKLDLMTEITLGASSVRTCVSRVPKQTSGPFCEPVKRSSSSKTSGRSFTCLFQPSSSRQFRCFPRELLLIARGARKLVYLCACLPQTPRPQRIEFAAPLTLTRQDVDEA